DDRVFECGVDQAVEKLSVCAFSLPVVEAEFVSKRGEFGSFLGSQLEVADGAVKQRHVRSDIGIGVHPSCELRKIRDVEGRATETVAGKNAPWCGVAHRYDRCGRTGTTEHICDREQQLAGGTG